MTLILASTSSARRAMLSQAGLTYTAEKPLVDEDRLKSLHPEWDPPQTALQLATAKALDVSARYDDAVVIGADQVLALGQKSFSKPGTIEEGRQQLRELRGRTHHLISAAVCARNGKVEWSETAIARLTMRNFSEAFLDDYLAAVGNDCLTSVGGYKVEGRGIQLFESIEGDFFTILGMPLLPLLKFLRSSGEVLA